MLYDMQANARCSKCGQWFFLFMGHVLGGWHNPPNCEGKLSHG